MDNYTSIQDDISQAEIVSIYVQNKIVEDQVYKNDLFHSYSHDNSNPENKNFCRPIGMGR